MTSINDAIFQATMRGLEAGLQVMHIAASPLETCDVSDDTTRVLGDARLKDFSYIPACRNRHIVGILVRSDQGSGPIIEVMRPLDASMLISAGAPLAKLIKLMADASYRLVVTEHGIEGIVTRSDLQKLPVRLFAFSLVTHLEMLMREIIAECYPNDGDWLALLPNELRKSIKKSWGKLKRDDLNSSKLECASLSAKCNILEQVLPTKEGQQLSEARQMLVDLRDSIAHAGSYAEDTKGLQQFITHLNIAQSWIDILTPILKNMP